MPDTAFKSLQNQHPWPATDGVTPWNFTLGGGGRHLVDTLIDAPDIKYMLEIGCFLGASARRWLSLKNDLHLIGLETWDDRLIEQCKRYVGRPGLTRAYPDIEVQQKFATDIERQGPFPTAMANLTAFKDRFIPVRGESPTEIHGLKEAGFIPDLVYIDAGKNVDDLEVCHQLWPEANITGDDWHWNRTKGYPMRKIVNGFADKHGFHVEADHATWVLYR